MLTARAKVRNQWNTEEVREEEHEFATINELENWLAYNRAYILTLSFTGEFTREDN